MLRRSRYVLLLAMSVSLACDRRDGTPASDSVGGDEFPARTAARGWEGSWSPELGDMLVVPSDSEMAIVLYPDSPEPQTVSAAPLSLLNVAGDTVTPNATLVLDDTLQCGDAPVAHLAAGTPTTWSVGLRGATATPLRVDSIEALAPPDSARAVADLARLASALTAKARSRFTGLPFAVLQARRFTVAASHVLAAHLVRRLPQEAAPLEEHTLIIAERARADTSYAVAFSQLSQGSEETAQYFDVISVVRAGERTLLLLARDATSRTEYQILERSASGAWRVRWTRPVSC